VEWFKWCDPSDLRVDDMVISWDTVMKATELSDYSVGTVWGVRGDLYYLLDLVRVRLDFPALKRMVIEVYDRWTSQQKPTILIEDAGSGADLIQELYGHDDVPAVARSVARRSQIGAVGLPLGLHDDQVDSISQALNWLFAGAVLRKPGRRPTWRSSVSGYSLFLRKLPGRASRSNSAV
jgi:phage terminase large subunit-like protein